MSRIVRIIITTAAAMVVSALGLTGPAAAPARASDSAQYFISAYDGDPVPPVGDAEYLHAHAHNYVIYTSNTGVQTWNTVNCEYVGNLSGQQQWACEIQLSNTISSSCLNDVPADDHILVDDSCVAGDANELFWITSLGNDSYWIINVAASADYGTYAYMTSDRGSGSPDVQDLPGGHGLYGVWEVTCGMNC